MSSKPSTIGKEGHRLWLYPDRRNGERSRRRRNIAIALIAFYMIAPYVSVGSEPFLRFNVLESRISVIGYSFRYTDASFAFFIFAILALILFLVTSVRGRIWCGYACPQTVFIDWVIRPIEQLIEGDHLQRRKRDQGAKNLGYWTRKITKQAVFLLLSAVVANTFLAYFIPPATLWQWMQLVPSEHPTAFVLMSLVLVAFYFDLGWFREQFCCFLCPYARFQSILVDRFTPTVAYDTKRGEPRGKKSESGDCIDCGLCVRVCPTGIDIRKGLQLECIACERCMDACDSIMTNIKKPTGLIRLASEAELSGEKSSTIRWRSLIYVGLLLVVGGGFFVALMKRSDVSLTIVRSPGQSFVRTDDGRIMNHFEVNVENNRAASVALGFEVLEPVGATLICGMCKHTLAPFKSQRINLVVLFPGDGHYKRAKIRFIETGREHELPLLSP